MDARKCMIVDLEKQGREMFITEKVAYIGESQNGLRTVRFGTSGRFFKYNTSRLLYMTRPERLSLGGRGFYVGKRRIADAAEILRFTDGEHTFYRLTHANGFYECMAAANVYVTRTPIDVTGGTVLGYLRKLADETGLMAGDADDGENLLARQYEKFVNGIAFLGLSSTDGQDERIRIGLRIRKIREERGIEARELAKLARIDAASLSRIENGKCSVGIDILSRIASALGKKVDFTEI